MILMFFNTKKLNKNNEMIKITKTVFFLDFSNFQNIYKIKGLISL